MPIAEKPSEPTGKLRRAVRDAMLELGWILPETEIEFTELEAQVHDDPGVPGELQAIKDPLDAVRASMRAAGDAGSDGRGGGRTDRQGEKGEEAMTTLRQVAEEVLRIAMSSSVEVSYTGVLTTSDELRVMRIADKLASLGLCVAEPLTRERAREIYCQAREAYFAAYFATWSKRGPMMSGVESELVAADRLIELLGPQPKRKGGADGVV